MAFSALVTGATGFVGQRLVARLRNHGVRVKRLLRRPPTMRYADVEDVVVGDFANVADWRGALEGTHAVFHLAAHVHITDRTARLDERTFFQVNTLATERIAQAAVACGVNRFVYLSTLGVHGSQAVAPIVESSPIAPESFYAHSKWNAERALGQLMRSGTTEFFILRPPLVYGPGNPGNLLRLLRLMRWRAPLPFASVANARSLLCVENLVDALVHIVHAPSGRGGTYLIADETALATPELIALLASRAPRPPALIAIPPSILRWLLQATGHAKEAASLLGSLTIDSSLIRDRLGWQPVVSAAAGLEAVSAWYWSQGAHLSGTET